MHTDALKVSSDRYLPHSSSPPLWWGFGPVGRAMWLVGRSGYTGMQGLLFVCERSGSGGECHWWLQRGRKNLQEVFSLSPRSPTLPLPFSLPLSLRLSFSIFFSVCVRTFTVPSLSLWGHGPQAQPLLCLALWTHTPPLLGAYVCQGQGNTGPLLLFLSTSLLLHG